MAGCKTDIDWAAKPAPWCWVGQQFRREIDSFPPTPVPFGRKVRTARKMMGITQSQLAVMVGYPEHGGMISAIETSEKFAVGERRDRLIEVLGIADE